jgi:hypothetical protein
MVAVGVVCTLAACSDTTDDPNGPASETESANPVETTEHPHVEDEEGNEVELQELRPSIGEQCLQIDRADPDSSDDPADANLVLGNDGNSDSYDQPSACSSESGDFTDWDELSFDGRDISEFQFKDVLSGKGIKDPSAFPSSDNEVGEANVTPKQDLVEAAIAFNNTGGTVEESFVDLGLLRGGTNGSSSYFWIFTKEESHIHVDENGDRRKTFDITPGDILVVGDFDPARGDILAVHRAVVDADGLSAVEVASPTGQTPSGDRIWGPRDDDPDIVAALNTTSTPKGSKLFDGTDANGNPIPSNQLTRDGDYEAGAFAEGAVPLSVFTEDGQCGNVFYGDVITRPSRSRTSDLKDELGPFVLNLGEIAANPKLTPTCGGDMSFEADPQITGLPDQDDGPLPDAECTWNISCDTSGDGTYETAVVEDLTNDCSSKLLSAQDAKDGTDTELFPLDSTDTPFECEANVTVTSTSLSGCVGEGSTTDSPFAPLDVTASAEALCEDPTSDEFDGQFDYYGEVDGGSGNYTVSWTFSAQTGLDTNGSSCSTAEGGECETDPLSGTDTSLHSSSSPGTANVARADAYTRYRATLNVTDEDQSDPDNTGGCSATASADAIPLEPLSVGLTTGGASNFLCDFDTTTTEDDSADFTATVASGGTGRQSFVWTDEDENGNDTGFCTDETSDTTGSDICTIDPDNNTQLCGTVSIKAKITPLDPDPNITTYDSLRPTDLCPAVETAAGSYSKETTVSASVP